MVCVTMTMRFEASHESFPRCGCHFLQVNAPLVQVPVFGKSRASRAFSGKLLVPLMVFEDISKSAQGVGGSCIYAFVTTSFDRFSR